jgi:5-methylcytosine-specific restriction endonuclease McrA
MPYKDLATRRERQRYIRSLSPEQLKELHELKKIKKDKRQLIKVAIKQCKLKRKCLRKEFAWFRRKMRKKAYIKTERGRAVVRAIKKKYLQNNPQARRTKVEWKKRWDKTEKGREAQRKKNRSPSQRALIAIKDARKRALEKNMTDFDKFVFKEAHLLRILRDELFKTKWHVDHTIPISVGGTNAYTNIEVVPAKWNLDKSNRHTERYFK